MEDEAHFLLHCNYEEIHNRRQQLYDSLEWYLHAHVLVPSPYPQLRIHVRDWLEAARMRVLLCQMSWTELAGNCKPHAMRAIDSADRIPHLRALHRLCLLYVFDAHQLRKAWATWQPHVEEAAESEEEEEEDDLSSIPDADDSVDDE